MVWEEAKDIRRFHRDDRVLGELAASFGDYEHAFVVASPLQFYDEWSNRQVGSLVLVLTSNRLIVARKKLLRTATTEYSVGDLNGYRVGLFLGGGPAWELFQQTPRGGFKLVFDTMDEAETVVAYVNDAVVLWRSRTG